MTDDALTDDERDAAWNSAVAEMMRDLIGDLSLLNARLVLLEEVVKRNGNKLDKILRRMGVAI